jgi:hypothetical protein
MPRIAIAQASRECKSCGEPATAGRYCHECDNAVREMIDNLDGRVRGTLVEQDGGQA